MAERPALSDRRIDEVSAADILVMGGPIYNGRMLRRPVRRATRGRAVERFGVGKERKLAAPETTSPISGCCP